MKKTKLQILLQAAREKIAPMRSKLFDNVATPKSFRNIYMKMLTDKKQSIGRLRPWAFWVEIVRGCNLSCGHCATRLFPKGEYNFMTKETWMQTLTIVNTIAPYSRLEIGNAGEPTLHPDLIEFIEIGRKLAPNVQFMIFTNGTQILSGKVVYEELFAAGLNMVFVDMYGLEEKHLNLAQNSRVGVVIQSEKRQDAPNVFHYYNDNTKRIIMLAQAPHAWPEKKVKRGAFSTFQNNLDWEAAKPFGLVPILEPPKRRCDIPTKYPTIFYDGSYSFCCFDFMREKAGSMGNVSEGVDGFLKYWLGEYMQDMRRKLFHKKREDHEYCKKCAFISIRADIPWWSEDLLQDYWTGEKWEQLK